MLCHSLSCVILGLPATEVCLLFLHQRVMPPDRKGRECYIQGGVGHQNTPLDEPCHHRCAQAKPSLGIGHSPQAEPVGHVCRVYFTHYSVHLTVIGEEKLLDLSPPALPLKILTER